MSKVLKVSKILQSLGQNLETNLKGQLSQKASDLEALKKAKMEIE